MKRLTGLLALCLCAATPALAHLLFSGATTPPVAIANVQGRSSSQTSTCSTTRSVSLARAVASGDAVTVTTGWFPSSSGTLSSVTDDKGNTYAFVQNQIGNVGTAAAYLTNITNAPTTVTMTFSGCVAFGDNVIDEWSGLGSFDVSASNTQTAPGTGTDAVTSTAATTTAAGDLIFGVCNVTNATVVNLGTGFSLTTGGVAAASNSKTEWKIQSAAGPVAATCTAVDGSQSTSAIAVAITRSGVPGARQLITSISPTTGSFTTGASSSFMTETATLTPSPPLFNGTWSVKTSGTDHTGVTTCNNYGSNLTIDSATGVISNSLSAPAQAYPGFCVTATEAGVSNSPYTQALSITGATQTVASISPSACSFAAGTQNGNICTLTIAMAPTSPGFTGTFGLCTGTNAPIAGCTGANSGGFQLVGAGPASKNLEQSSAPGGTGPGTYTDVTAYAQQTGIPSAFQKLTLTGNAVVVGSTITTADYFMPTIGTAPPGGKAPYTFGQAFRMADVPSGTCAAVADATGAALTYQVDQAATSYSDGSTRYAVYSALLPVSGGNANGRVKLILTNGPCTATSTPRSVADVTGHRFQVHFQNVLTHPGTNDPFVGGHVYSWGNKGPGSSNYTFDVNAAIAANSYRVTALGPVKISLHVYGFMTEDGGAADPNLWVDDYIDVYTDPSNPTGPPLYFEHMPEISQPFINPSNGTGDFVIGQASYCDGVSTGAGCTGATKLKDYADNVITMGPSDVTGFTPCATGYCFNNPTSVIMQSGMAWRVHLIPGNTLPGGMTDGQPVWNQNGGAGIGTAFVLDPQVIARWQNTASFPTSAGAQSGCSTNCHASFQLQPYQHIAYYNGIFIVANEKGDPILSPGSWTAPVRALPNLDGTTGNTTASSQKAYWIQSGAAPPWDLPFGNTIEPGPALFANHRGGSSQIYYEPGSNGIQRNTMDATGGDWDTDGPWDEAAARWFMTMGRSGWGVADAEIPWARALNSLHLPNVAFKRTPTGTGPTGDGHTGPNPGFIVPLDNGPGNSQTYPGTPWPSLGLASPSDVWYAENCDCINTQTGYVLPVGFNNQPFWDYGTFDNDFSNYHWPPSSAILEYLFYGKPYLLDIVAGNATRSLLQQIYTVTERHRVVGGTTYYGLYFFDSAWGEVVSAPAAAGYFAPASDPIAPYFQNVIQQNSAFQQATYNSESAAQKQAGASLNAPYGDGFNHSYAALGFFYAQSVSRLPMLAMKDIVTLRAGMFDAPGDPATNTGLSTWGIANSSAISEYSTYLGGWTPVSSSFVPNPTQFYASDMLDHNTMPVASNGVIDYSNGSTIYYQYMNPSNGDEMWPVVDLGLGATTCIGPAEYCPSPTSTPLSVSTKLHVCQLNTTAMTFRLTYNGADNLTTCPSAITSIAAPGDYRFAVRTKVGTTQTSGLWFGSTGVDQMLIRAGLMDAYLNNMAPDSFYGVNLDQALKWFEAREALNTNITGNTPTTPVYSRLFHSRSIPLSPPLPPS